MKTLLHSNFIAALVGAASMLYAQISAAPFAQPNWAAAATSRYVPGEVLVKFKPAAIAQERTASVAALGHTVLTHMERLGWMHVKLAADQSVTEALAVYRKDPNVEAVQPNYIYRAAAVPSDTQYGQLWAFKNTGQPVTTGTYAPNSGTAGDDMNIEPAWDHITDCRGVVVAVVDSGVNYNQEDLAANMWSSDPRFPNHGWNYVNNNNDPMDLDGHGTHVAGIIGAAGNNAKGTTGICWTASIMAVRVLDATGFGSDATIIQGIDFAITHGARVISMSLGSDGSFDPAFSDAITTAQTNDIVVIVSAGNKAKDNDAAGGAAHYPCNFTQPNLVCVAALDQNYALARFSNWGAISVDVGAPGTNILSTWAGAETTMPDNFNSGGALNWTTSGSGWGYRQLTLTSGLFDALVNPTTFPSGTYANNADNRVYKTFTLGGFNAATLNFFAQVAIQSGDSLNVNYRSGGGDPFAGGVQLKGGSGTTGAFLPFSFDFSACISATCSVGFQLLSDASGTGQGAGIVDFSIQTLQLNTTTYNTISGTSMATPEVAGLAVMLRAYNPQYTYADTVCAIKNGGRSVAALAGKTTTGKAIDVMSSLAYINPPTGLTAAVQ
jgi:subtilisin family serine protease